MSTFIQTWDHRLVPVEAPGRLRGAAPERPVLVTAELAEDVEVRQFQAQAVPVVVTANGTHVLDGVELGASESTKPPHFSPAYFVDGQTCLLTTSLAPGRYVVFARYAGQVVRATPGILRVR